MKVVVVGAGICGASAALELAQRGVEVVLVERGEVAQATTGVGEGNVLCSDKRPGPEMVLAQAGRAMWDELDERFPEAAKVRRKGALVLFEDGGAEALAATLSAAGVDCEALDGAAAHALEPALAADLAGAVHAPGELQVDPRALTRALADEAVRLGAKLRTHEEVIELDMEYGTVKGVWLQSGPRVVADAVVMAVGPWSPGCIPRKGQLVALGPAPGLVQRKLYEAAYMDNLAFTEETTVSAVVEEALSGEVYVGSSRSWEGLDDAIDPSVTARMIERAARFVPGVAGLEVRREWAGFRPYREAGPAVGPSTTMQGLWHCTGHEGGGVGMGPVSGRLIAQLITGEAPVVDPAPYAPD